MKQTDVPETDTLTAEIQPGTVLYQVQEYARNAHKDQRRKYADELYIEHPIRVMKTCNTVTTNTEILAAALLHDVLEDTAVTAENVREFLLSVMPEATAAETLLLVVELTDVYTKEAYPQWNRRERKKKEMVRLSGASDEAQTVKYADIIDNAQDIVNCGDDFAQKFLFECRTLLRSMTRGNRELRDRAVALVERSLAEYED